MPSLNIVAFLLLEKRKTTDRDQLNLKNQISKSNKRENPRNRLLGADIKGNSNNCQHEVR
ncbi:hypothetical protein AL540_006590 [Vibrio harveyi]|uniref:Uncharacterized protein n=1 Tax=Vibrio harveyi TaxID=669 RepID=A0ABN5GW15_VIBHA|nr:hypothetical protein BG259_19315 [Vibrio harveyi]AUW38388.1 hypothetical protein AL538_28705 [Vibrio harveyi]AWB01396.1 hypothetical protein CU052_19225 [Vibrio harveyi]KNY40230.1 hypothetical protein AKG93_20890 [Vibrio harveyi]PNM52365.1 hypothetical protein AL469_009970 [Vibrio harveyi]